MVVGVVEEEVVEEVEVEVEVVEVEVEVLVLVQVGNVHFRLALKKKKRCKLVDSLILFIMCTSLCQEKKIGEKIS